MDKEMNDMENLEDFVADDALTNEEQAYLEGKGEGEVAAGEEAAVAQDAGQGEQAGEDSQEAGGRGEGGKEGAVKMVPHQALHAEREERRRIGEEKNRLAAEKARLEARLDMILAKMGGDGQGQVGGEGQGQEGQDMPPPDPAEDMVGFMRWQAQALARQQQEAKAAQMRLEQARQSQEQEAALHALVDRSRQEVADELPDVGEAIDFLRQVRDRQLEFLSSVEPQMADPQVRSQMIEEEARQLIVAAARQGQNPIRLLYDLARNNGYNGQGRAAQGVQGGQGAGVVDRVEAIASAQGAAKTLASSAGTAAATPTAEMIANMSEEEFGAWYEKNARTFNKIMGA